LSNLETKFLRIAFFLVEIAGISGIQFTNKRWETAYRVPALAGRAWDPSPAG